MPGVPEDAVERENENEEEEATESWSLPRMDRKSVRLGFRLHLNGGWY
jgi:hypothetical protein